MGDSNSEVKRIAESVQEFKTNKNQKAFNYLLEALKPVVLKNAKRLYFMEQEDAIQELNIAIFQAVCNIKYIKNENACFAYILNCLHYCYCKLCSTNIVQEVYLEQVEVMDKNDNAFIDCIYLNDLFSSNLSEKEKQILILLYYGYTDSEIGAKMGTSRQYINRVKKKLLDKVELEK